MHKMCRSLQTRTLARRTVYNVFNLMKNHFSLSSLLPPPLFLVFDFFVLTKRHLQLPQFTLLGFYMYISYLCQAASMYFHRFSSQLPGKRYRCSHGCGLIFKNLFAELATNGVLNNKWLSLLPFQLPYCYKKNAFDLLEKGHVILRGTSF